MLKRFHEATYIHRHSEINKKALFPSPLAENTKQLNVKMLDLQTFCAYNDRGSIKTVK